MLLLMCGVHKSILYPSNNIDDSMLGQRNNNVTLPLTRGVNGPWASRHPCIPYQNNSLGFHLFFFSPRCSEVLPSHQRGLGRQTGSAVEEDIRWQQEQWGEGVELFLAQPQE